MRFLKVLLPLVASTLCFAAQSDRIAGTIDSSQGIPLAKSLHPQAQPQYDLGPADPSLKLTYMTLLMAPSPSQQKALDQLLAQQQDRSSANYHKWLTPQQFADRFGLSQNDVNKVAAWLQSEGFQILSVGGGRNAVSFSGTAAQVQRAFGTEIHNYKILGEEHFANSTPLMIPATLNGIVSSVLGTHSFLPRPASQKRSFSGRRNSRPDYFDVNFIFPNFLAPGDIATIYDINALYNASSAIDGTGQKLAIVGQTDVYLADINDFRAGFGLNQISGCTSNANGVVTACSATNFQYVLVAGSVDPGTTFACGDLGEADLDIEWSGAVARNAQIVYVNSPVTWNASCTSGTGGGVTASLNAVINPPSGPALAPVVSMSYGACEAQAGDLETLLQQGNAEGVTIMNSSGDLGAATCDFNPPNSSRPFSPAIGGLAVSYPASSPEVTGVGGTSISLANDSYPFPSAFWSTSIGANGGTAVSYIPELVWNDDEGLAQYCHAPFSGDTFCVQPGTSGWVPLTSSATAAQVQEDIWLSIGGGGASNCFTQNGTVCQAGFPQPTWQQGLSVPSAPAGVRYSPDVSLFASPNFPGYIFCTAQNPPSVSTSTCVNGITFGIENFGSIVGGTSASSPVFAGIVTLLNQYLGANGLGNINPMLYTLAANSSNGAFQPVTSGDNNVTCQPNTPSIQPTTIQCPAAGVMGYSASNFDPTTHYNLVTGLGSIDANKLFSAWAAARSASSITITPSATNVSVGSSESFAVAVTPATGVGTVSFSTVNNGVTTVLGTATLNVPYPPSQNGTATFTTTSLPGGSNSVTATYEGDTSNKASMSASTAITVTGFDFTLGAGSASPTSVPAGQSVSVTLTVTPVNASTQTVNFTNSANSPNFTPGSCTAGLPTGALCSFNPTSVTLDGNPAHPMTVILTITTAANMPLGAQTITVTGTPSSGGGISRNATANLAVIATNQSFTLSSTNGATFPVALGGTASVQVAVAGTGSPIPFVSTSMSNPTTALPLTYACTGVPALPASEIACQISPSNGQNVSAAAVTVSLVTTPATAQLRPFGSSRIFYALLLPGLFGVVFLAGSRTRGIRLLSLIVVLGFSTLWLSACGGGGGGNNIQPNPGTPPGMYTVTISATTGGANPVPNSGLTIMLNVQ